MTIINFKSNSKNLKPWLNSNGLPISDQELKEISKSWDQKTWDDYLTWFESPLRELQIPTLAHDKLADQMEESIFESCHNIADDELQEQIKSVLEQITPKQYLILRMIFWQGKSEQEIANHLGISRSSVRDIKSRGLKQLAKILKTPTTKITLMRAQIIPLSSGVKNDQKNYPKDFGLVSGF